MVDCSTVVQKDADEDEHSLLSACLACADSLSQAFSERRVPSLSSSRRWMASSSFLSKPSQLNHAPFPLLQLPARSRRCTVLLHCTAIHETTGKYLTITEYGNQAGQKNPTVPKSLSHECILTVVQRNTTGTHVGLEAKERFPSKLPGEEFARVDGSTR